jgi:hypothetical protein
MHLLTGNEPSYSTDGKEIPLNNTVPRTLQSITGAEISKARIVFARSITEIVGSNCTRGLDVCLHLVCVCVLVFKKRLHRTIPRERSPTD